MNEDLESPDFHHGVQQGFWKLVRRDNDVLYIELYAPDDRSYLARLTCDCYGTQPIDAKFVMPETLTVSEAAWPKGNNVFNGWMKFAGTDLFICWDQDRTGIARHPEWATRRAWTMSSNQLVTYLDFFRRMLHLPARGYASKNA